MLSLQNKNHRITFLIVLIALFSLFALWLRLIPMFNMGGMDILNVVATDDPIYNLRLVEQTLHNFPGYGWFEAMTLFPTGQLIHWGPLFTDILSVACIIAGASTRPEIIGVCLLIPPILATLLVPIMYFVGRCCGDWKTGLFASGFTAIVTGQYFTKSYYGYLDHHIAEVFFTTIFCLAYIYALQAGKKADIRFDDVSTLKKPALLSTLAGIAYLLGLFTMPTMILFALIVAIFTLFQFIIDSFRRETSEYLVLTNCIIFAVAIIGLLLFGIKVHDNLSLAHYTFGHIYAYLSLICITVALYGIARVLKGRNRLYYPLVLAGLGMAGSLVLFIINTDIFNLLISNFFSFFGQSAESMTVQEARGWDFASAWLTFNYGLILMTLGFVVLAYKNFREEHPYQVFAIVWSAIILFSTWQHVRYEYYLAINIALLAAVIMSFVIDLSCNEIAGLLNRSSSQTPTGERAADAEPEIKRGKKQKKDKAKSERSGPKRNLAAIGIFFLVAALSVLFVVYSVGISYSVASERPTRMNTDWREALEWMDNSTPSTGVDYYAIYDQSTFKYPDSAYGVMSWWDYGHIITYIGKRIPNANPFQSGVAGEYGAAAYFMTTSEGSANAILDKLGTKFVITDYEMDVTKFWAMATWYNETEAIKPYEMYFAISDPDQPANYQQVLLNNATYYKTMVSRLHNFDGSIGTPSTAYYLEYADSSLTQISLPLITTAKAMNASDAVARAAQYNIDAKAGYHALVMNPVSAVYAPIETVPALHNYRLVHESPTNVYDSATVDIRYVKVFEYMKGARIKGEGTIEVPVITNTGRNFTYRQQSTNGEFIVPYATTGNPYDVKTTGKYRITGTDKEFEVTEDAVQKGLAIN